MKHFLFCALCACFIFPANASCDSWETVSDYLSSQHAERQIVAGVTSDGRRMEMWVSGSQTWTVLVIASDVACLVMAGNSFNVIRDAAYGDPIRWPGRNETPERSNPEVEFPAREIR